MLKRIMKTILLVPVAVLVIVLAVANRTPVVLSFDPFSPAQPAFSIEVPLFWLMFAMLFIGIVLGGLGAWARQGKWRRQARRKRREAEHLRQEADRLKDAQPPAPGLPAPRGQRAA